MNTETAGHRNWAQLLIIGGVLAPMLAFAGLTATYVWHRAASPAPASARSPGVPDGRSASI